MEYASCNMPSTPPSRRITAAHAFFLGALMAFIALSPAIFPYGGQFVTRGDLIEQQLPFLVETRRILRGGLNSYSFSTFLGAPALGSYAFYTLGSPFVWPIVLLPKATLPYAISVMAVLKHAVCALCSFCYMRRMVRNDRLALLGSVLYTFSSFTVVNTQFYHFTEVIAFFPLILLGLEDAMSTTPHAGFLALACGLNALTNYYFMLGSALLAALYFVFRFFSRDWRRARTLQRVICVVFECVVGCALAGVLLLPAMHFMLTLTRTGAGDIPLLSQRYPLSTLLERLRTLLMPIESGVVHAFYGNAPSWTSTAAYLPMFGLTGVFVFLIGKKCNWLKALLALLGFICFIPALCGLFVLETNTSYTRWWYGLSLLLTLATLYALRDVPLCDSSHAWRMAFIVCMTLISCLTLPFLLPQSALDALSGLGGTAKSIAQSLQNQRTGAYAPDAFRWLSLGLSLFGGGAMCFVILRKPSWRTILALTCITACVQYSAYIATGDALILSGGETAGSGVYSLSEIAEPTISALKLPEPTEYKRIDYGSKLRNYGLLCGHSSLTCFSSLRSSTVGRFVTMAGFGHAESTTVKPPDNSAALRAFLSVSEYHQLDGEPVPEGFIYDHTENGFPVYVNDAAVPMGFLQTVITGTYDQRMDSETIGTVLLAAAALDNSVLLAFEDRLVRLDVNAVPDWKESAARLRANACDWFETTASGFSAHITAHETGLLVFTIPYDKGFSAKIDGQSAEIIPCDVSFMAVWVEPGEHTIEFTYHTRSLTLGIAMSLLAAVILTGYCLLKNKRMICSRA